MIGTATRPNGVGLVAACVVASFIAIRRSRDWMSLVAVVLSPLGFIGFQLYVDHTAGERGAWFRVQSEAWKEGTSFGATAVTNTLDFVPASVLVTDRCTDRAVDGGADRHDLLRVAGPARRSHSPPTAPSSWRSC